MNKVNNNLEILTLLRSSFFEIIKKNYAFFFDNFNTKN